MGGEREENPEEWAVNPEKWEGGGRGTLRSGREENPLGIGGGREGHPEEWEKEGRAP